MDGDIRLTGPAPGFQTDPSHFVDVEPTPRRVRVQHQGEFIADSLNALVTLEKNHTPVYYFPRSDVKLEVLESTDHSSH